MCEHNKKQYSSYETKFNLYENNTFQTKIEGKNDVNLLNYILSQLTKNKIIKNQKKY